VAVARKKVLKFARAYSGMVMRASKRNEPGAEAGLVR